MSKPPHKRSGLQAPLSIPAPRWPGEFHLELIHEFNELFIGQLAEVAREGDSRATPAWVRTHRNLWVNLDAAARRRASRCPFLLADIQFRNATWWRHAKNEATWQGDPPDPGRLFPSTPAVQLMEDALVVAWSTARQDARLAVALLAMSDEVADIVARLGLRERRRIAAQHHQHLRPRWEHLSSFWGPLLIAASRDDGEALYDLHLYAFQLADGR